MSSMLNGLIEEYSSVVSKIKVSTHPARGKPKSQRQDRGFLDQALFAIRIVNSFFVPISIHPCQASSSYLSSNALSEDEPQTSNLGI